MVVIDVRSPSEYATGHIVGAVNLPLFSDEERARVGTIYKQVGRAQAVECGLGFVGPKMVDIVRAARQLSKNDKIELYCARGGMRSGSVGWLLRTAGLEVSILSGGYKAYRAKFEQSLELDHWNIITLSGATGSGKTELLQVIKAKGSQVLDLEGLANHRGSVFGGVGQGDQPTTEHFINLLHNEFEGFDLARPVFCEGESMLIGHVYLPRRLYDLMQTGQQIEVTASREERLERIVEQYGALPVDQLRECFLKIAKRLGPEQTKNAVAALDCDDIRAAASIGLEYYDKCYKKGAQREQAMALELSRANVEKQANKLIERYEQSC